MGDLAVNRATVRLRLVRLCFTQKSRIILSANRPPTDPLLLQDAIMSSAPNMMGLPPHPPHRPLFGAFVANHAPFLGVKGKTGMVHKIHYGKGYFHKNFTVSKTGCQRKLTFFLSGSQKTKGNKTSKIMLFLCAFCIPSKFHFFLH